MKRTIVLAYLAGVIDSDGSITIATDRWRVAHQGRSKTYSENVGVGQCDPQAIELLKETFGGHMRAEKSRGPNRRPMYHWGATDKNAVNVLRELLPYLRIKRRQAELALKLRSLKDRGRIANGVLDETPRIVNTRWGPRPRRWWRTKPEVIAEYEALVAEIRGLNDSRWPFRGAAANGVLIEEVGSALTE